ncbi:hypothetical protein B0T26DRAFT_7198 [Lasiosphaeria miniovina]|uniref:Uncharacterized protein n=1 Tax=Lasiosphaeria miniovina TaxID=1954250 RepID=A0AA40BFA7_9PEZI|nr:uncharacterized protein B0T26DRAFT_7198 [Lasiosphaeria miniovina]KAK0733202.1 hypothetical protein B0T26DRAFT_7198 [Lasiosphaeria miniovina]
MLHSASNIMSAVRTVTALRATRTALAPARIALLPLTRSVTYDKGNAPDLATKNDSLGGPNGSEPPGPQKNPYNWYAILPKAGSGLNPLGSALTWVLQVGGRSSNRSRGHHGDVDSDQEGA